VDLIPLSALQHYLYCPRQCALIHVERLWSDNRFTAEGRILHERVDAPGNEVRKGVRTVTAMPIRSLRLGVHGVADLVEIHGSGERLKPLPVDYKRGRPKAHRADEVQLCAQAMALEEMFRTEVPEGALFYGEPRRRTSVTFDLALRELTTMTAAATRRLIAENRTPRPLYERRKCEACSLIDLCRPRALGRKRDITHWLASSIES
jgi:CRISPR-associated exonuclease Cas4